MDRRPLIADWPNSAFQKWAYGFCYKNLWRVQNLIGVDESEAMRDALAECALLYVEARNRYGAAVNSPQHFMRLYQTIVITTFHTLSNKATNQRKLFLTLFSEIQDEAHKDDELQIAVRSDCDMTIALSEASSDLKAVLNVFLNAPEEIIDALRKKSTSKNPKQFFNTVLQHLGINKNKTPALAKELKKLLE